MSDAIALAVPAAATAVQDSALGVWLRRLEMRTAIDAEDRGRLLALPHEMLTVQANRDFVRLGEHTHFACLVVEGLVGRFGQSSTGLRQVSAIHIPGDMADLHSVVVPTASTALSALSPATIARVPHSALRELGAARPELARAFWRECVVDASVLAEAILTIGRRPGLARVAHLLCELAVRFAMIGQGDGLTFELTLTQAHMADICALTSVHVNRTLRDLREAGIVTVAQRQVTIHDWRKLVRAGDFDPLYLGIPQERLDAVLQRLNEAVSA